MNKAFVREPDFDGRGYCPRCGGLGVAVRAPVLDAHIQPEPRKRLIDSAWFCPSPSCLVAYFDSFEAAITVDELGGHIYPKDPSVPICACFGFTIDDIAADVHDGVPTRIRQLLAKSQSPHARCAVAAADGQCCMREVQRLYLKLRGDNSVAERPSPPAPLP